VVDQPSNRPAARPGESRLDRIARRARELYEARGGAHGRDLDDWLAAEREIDAEIKRVGYRAVDLIAEHVASLPYRPVFQPFPRTAAAKYLETPPPDHGESADEVFAAFEQEIAPYPFGNGHPRFYGWVNSPPVIMGIFAEALAAAMNPSCAGGNHAAVYVERQVVNWFKHLTGFPATGMGLLVSGGSMAALTALAVARHVRSGFDVRAKGLQAAPRRLIFYKTREGHSCHQKAIELLGIGHESLRIVAHDDALQMDPTALDAAIQADIREGHTPVAVIASAGTVNTGAIDPIDAIADVCARHHVWLHVDGAYGAPAILSAPYSRQLSPLARADSVALDPHKWLYVPVEAGLVLIRDADAMRRAFSLVPPYLRTDSQADGVGGLPWFSEYGFQQTRAFRALKVWMAMRYHGVDGYRESIERDIQLAGRLAGAIRAADDFDLFEPQSLSIVCFRYVPAHIRHDDPAANALNRAVLEKVQLEGRVFLSSTVMDDRFWLRACFVNPRARESDVLSVIDAVRDAARLVAV
jgi:aromatic-L-amino-acid/L-tryptophan decarboxylase